MELRLSQIPAPVPSPWLEPPWIRRSSNFCSSPSISVRRQTCAHSCARVRVRNFEVVPYPNVNRNPKPKANASDHTPKAFCQGCNVDGTGQSENHLPGTLLLAGGVPTFQGRVWCMVVQRDTPSPQTVLGSTACIWRKP